MRLIYNDALNKRIAPYLERLTKKRTSLDKETMALLDVFMQYFNMDTRYGAYSDKLEPCIIYIIQEEKIKSVANLFDGKLNKLLRYLLGDEYAHLFHTYLKLKARCPYTHGYSRRSQRSANPLLHIGHVIDALTQFLKLRATGFTDQAILNGGNTPEEIEAYKDSMNCQNWMAAQIAEGNQTVIEYLNNVLTSENIVALARVEVEKKDEFTAFHVDFHYGSRIPIDWPKFIQDQRDPSDDGTAPYLSFSEEKMKNYEYNLAVVFTSSKYGAYFAGSVGSTLCIDKVEIVCEK